MTDLKETESKVTDLKEMEDKEIAIKEMETKKTVLKERESVDQAKLEVVPGLTVAKTEMAQVTDLKVDTVPKTFYETPLHTAAEHDHYEIVRMLSNLAA